MAGSFTFQPQWLESAGDGTAGPDLILGPDLRLWASWGSGAGTAGGVVAIDPIALTMTNYAHAPIWNPSGICTDGTVMYVPNSTRGISIYTTAGTETHISASTIRADLGCVYMGGYIWTTNLGSTIYRTDTLGTVTTNTVTGSVSLQGLCTDGAFVYVADYNKGGVWTIDSGFAASFTALAGSGPAWTSIGSDGDVWCNDALNAGVWNVTTGAFYSLPYVTNRICPSQVYNPVTTLNDMWATTTATNPTIILQFSTSGVLEAVYPTQGWSAAGLFSCVIASTDPLGGNEQLFVGDGDFALWGVEILTGRFILQP